MREELQKFSSQLEKPTEVFSQYKTEGKPIGHHIKEWEASALLKGSGKVDAWGQEYQVQGFRKQIVWFKLFLNLTNINFGSWKRLMFQVGSYLSWVNSHVYNDNNMKVCDL